MAIAPSVIDDVRERADIVSLISEYVKLTKRGANFLGLCPFHQEKTPSFNVSPQKNIWHCFGCGEGGNVFTFLMKINNWPFIEALRYVASKVGVSLPEDKDSSKENQKYNYLYDQLEKECEKYRRSLFSPEGEIAMSYLKNRGFSEEIIKDFMIGYSRSGKFNNRIIFPIHDIRNRCLAFGGRVINNKNKQIPKYINSSESPIYNKGSHLYALNIAKPFIQKKDKVIIVEGYLDVIACHQVAVNNVIAVLGTALTQKQAFLIKRFTKNIILALDNDQAGQKATDRSIDVLKSIGMNVFVSILPEKDPDETIKKHGVSTLQEKFDNSLPSIKYQIDRILNDFDLTVPEQKSMAITASRRILEKENQVLQEEYKKYLAERLKIGYITLESFYAQGLENKYSPKSVLIHKKNPMPKGEKIAMCLINVALKDVSLRHKVFSCFNPNDFLNPKLINIAAILKETNDKFDLFFEKIKDKTLKKLIAEIAFMENPIDLDGYISAFKEYKKEASLTDIKNQIQLAEEQEDYDNVKKLQETYWQIKTCAK